MTSAAALTAAALLAGATATPAAGAPARQAQIVRPALANTEAPVRTERTVIDSGHVDAVSPRIADGAFQSLLLDDRDALAPVWRTPESVILHLTGAGALHLTADTTGFEFLGSPGDTVYCIPQTQDPALIWAGWSTQSFTPDDVDGDLTLSLDAVDGPGDVVLWEWSPFGEPETVLDSRAGLPAHYPVPSNTHQHANWAFTEPGVYRLTFTWNADLNGTGPVSDSSVYTFAVGDLDTATITLPGDQPSTSPSPSPSPSVSAAPSSSPSPSPSPSAGVSASPSPSTTASASASTSTSAAPDPSPASPRPSVSASATTRAPAPAPASAPEPAATATAGQLASTGFPLTPVLVTAGLLLAAGAALLTDRHRVRRPD
ncbi:choice-of-anchor M domain-containing protein [Kitasatospora sp. SolWspMP-SS2h]|uniref:choice-of-anchor M domain-containing protein n=1 Tax=Kitasatospora sp. SolWspMP-SS2h TaxID=1305729 RepID=UPI000DBA00EE|nr:choice-of-anchor M domain-containing protein [Kitasatospora sp. SolWspMP-SS2h]